jgi:hypothetical protein
MSKRKSGEAAFAGVQTPAELASALQKRVASGSLTVAEMRAVELIVQLRGWTKSSAPATESPATAKPVPFEEPRW